MTKADIIARIAQDTGIEKSVATTVVEAFMESVRESMIAGNEEKKARNFSKNTTIVIPSHHVPAFKPAKTFLDAVKEGK